MAKQIITVTGKISPEELGLTSMHEHVFAGPPSASLEGGYVEQLEDEILDRLDGELPFEPGTGEITLRNLRALWSGAFLADPAYWEWDDPEIAREELELFARAGGDCLVSVSTGQMTRMAGEMRQVSEETGVKVVAATGFYVHEYWPAEYFGWSVDDMVRFILDEVERGLDGTDVRPGILKAAGNVLDEPTIRALSACARAQAETGLSLLVHNGVMDWTTEDSWRMLEIILEAGADPSRLIWSHAQNLVGNRDIAGILADPDSFCIDVGFLARVADEGVTICVDTFGMAGDFDLLGSIDQPEIQQAIIVVKLIQSGYADRVVVGHDASWKLCASRYAGTGFTRIPSWLVPNLRAAGYSEEDIHLLTVANPARLLAV